MRTVRTCESENAGTEARSKTATVINTARRLRWDMETSRGCTQLEHVYQPFVVSGVFVRCARHGLHPYRQIKKPDSTRNPALSWLRFSGRRRLRQQTLEQTG